MKMEDVICDTCKHRKKCEWKEKYLYLREQVEPLRLSFPFQVIVECIMESEDRRYE